MGRPGEVAFLLALVILLWTLHGTRAQYDDYDYDDEEYEDACMEDGDCDEDGDGFPDEEYAEAEDSGEDDSEHGDEGGRPPTGEVQNIEYTPMCNNEDCWIRVDWEPPPRDTWMSCLLGYRVGYKTDVRWTWINDEGTHRDLRSDKLFFFEEAEGTNHSLTIRDLEFDTRYEVIVEVFNPYGGDGDTERREDESREINSHLTGTPPGLVYLIIYY